MLSMFFQNPKHDETISKKRARPNPNRKKHDRTDENGEKPPKPAAGPAKNVTIGGAPGTKM
jgi:hypothetical protein